MLDMATTFEQRWIIVAPVITMHLAELRMDTDEDNELLDKMREQWRWLVEGDAATAITPTLPKTETTEDYAARTGMRYWDGRLFPRAQ